MEATKYSKSKANYDIQEKATVGLRMAGEAATRSIDQFVQS